VRNRLVEGVLSHADRTRAQVEPTDVHGIQRGRKGFHTGVQNILGAHRMVVQPEGARVALQVHDVVDQVVVLVLAVGGKEDVAVGPVDVTASSDTDTMLATLPLPM
jgi:hypothetical protein